MRMFFVGDQMLNKYSYIKVGIIGTVLLLIWLWMSSSILLFISTHHIGSVKPNLYLKMWINFYKNQHAQKLLIASGLIAAIIILFVALVLSKRVIPNIHGNARFATVFDLITARLFSKKGIYLGKAFSRYLCIDGYEHVTLFAPTGTGKTVGLTIPNLLSWEDSCVASDIKLQLFQHTSKYRESIGQKVYLWNPGSPDGITHCYNPLDVITDNPYSRIDDIQKIAAIFIPDNPKSEPIWQVQSRFLFVGLVLYVLDTPEISKNISEVVRLVKAQPDFAKFVIHVLSTRADLDELCRFNLMKFSELHEKTRLSILATFQSYFELFDNPMIAFATSKSDFNIQNLRREKMTIYVGVTNDNLVRLAPLLTVFYQQVADVLTRKIPGDDEPFGVLFLMDEFSSLRRMQSFQSNIGLYREYKMRMVLIIQELSQLYDIYGRDGAKVFINAKIRMAFTQNDIETCKLIESILGNTTLSIKNYSRKIRTLLENTDRNESTQYVARPLLLAQEIMMLPEETALIMVQGYPPVYAGKITWFNDMKFKNKMLGAITVNSILKKLEVKKESHNVLYSDLETDLSTFDLRDKDFSTQVEELDQII